MSFPLIALAPQFHARVWGGEKLAEHAADNTPIGEAWLVFEENQIISAPFQNKTLRELISQHADTVLGARLHKQFGARFPLLIKLLDCRDWLSIQVHPNDEQAIALEGDGQFGKTEAWYILDATPSAKLVAGLRSHVTREQAVSAIHKGQIEPLCTYVHVERGDAVMMRAGTIHALGPGLFVYEVQQTSDITYRVFDWNRPASAGRKLHLDQSAAVVNPDLHAEIHRASNAIHPHTNTVAACEYFVLDELNLSAPLSRDTRGESFHAITVIAGELDIVAGDARMTLKPYSSVIVPAAQGTYQLVPHGTTQALCASA